MSQKRTPYLEFSREDWRVYRNDTPLTLSEDELDKLRGQSESVSLSEVAEVYLPLSRLLNLYVAASQDLHKVTSEFLGRPEPKVPFVIGVVGSVGVGKSTTSRILQALLSQWPSHPGVELLSTDHFLYSNAELKKRGLADRKGFPESYDIARMTDFLLALKSGQSDLTIPVYSHRDYDIVPGKTEVIKQSDIVIVEGVNISQPEFTSYFDFTVYVDAETNIIRDWFLDRFMRFREKARSDEQAFFHQFTKMTDEQTRAFATQVWTETNELNLNEHILPYKERAHLILGKGKDHSVQNILLRKL